MRTGWADVPLSHQERQEAIQAANRFSNYRIDVCFTSLLIRAIETAVICLTERKDAPTGRSPVLKHNRDDPLWHGWNDYESDPAEEIPVFFISGP